MRTTITEAEAASYERDGFLLMPDFLDAAELADWRSATERGVAARLAQADGLSNAGSDPFYRRVFTQVSGLIRVEPRMAELTAWHLDAPYWSFDDRRALTAWVALDDATVENGCLWYLPGTHLSAGFDAVELGSDLGGLFETYPQWRELPSVPAVLPAGGAVWHNGLIAHGAGANMTPRGRRAMTCAYMPDGVAYNGRRDKFVFTAEQAAAMRVGRPLDDDVVNPLVGSMG